MAEPEINCNKANFYRNMTCKLHDPTDSNVNPTVFCPLSLIHTVRHSNYKNILLFTLFLLCSHFLFVMKFRVTCMTLRYDSHLEPCQTFKMERFAKMVCGHKPLIVFAK